MQARSADSDRPFVETSIARQLMSRLSLTHDERGISVISGPWGIGKTTALDAFAADRDHEVLIVKVDPGATKRGANGTAVLQMVLHALSERGRHRNTRDGFQRSFWALRNRIYDLLEEIVGEDAGEQEQARFTFIFDEAQYLSREAIEMLRFWNDSDRTTTPIPVGLVFVGNNEFSLQDDASGQSVISGAVRSRALFIESLEYADVSDTDLTLFGQSRGVTDPAAIRAFVAHFATPRIRRDLRTAERYLSLFRRRAGDGAVTAEIVRSILQP